MQEKIHATAHGAVIYDPHEVDHPSDQLFEPTHWQTQGISESRSGGRGHVIFVNRGAIRWVLRHYRRGGLIARIATDQYVWTGADRTRSFREWRLLVELQRRGLPVPRPIAARYCRTGLLYRADLITAELPPSHPLAQLLSEHSLAPERWAQIGATIARFHKQGVCHADLNAHNILVASNDGAVYVLDFDRGRLRARGAWEDRVLARLQRSLMKIKAQQPQIAFGAEHWQVFMRAYRKHAS